MDSTDKGQNAWKSGEKVRYNQSDKKIINKYLSFMDIGI
jgi:hypothetical protein